ncbi:hypothetical protein [Nocardioides endophyticus]|uniref:hypothetical protein n=1 Tax=Nocardioides endophyticus TaxID=1353775 RepID=UPI0031EE66FD
METALNPETQTRPRVTGRWLEEAAARVISELEGRRATWQSWHMYAETQRQVRGTDVSADKVSAVVQQLVDEATRSLMNLTPARAASPQPE